MTAYRLYSIRHWPALLLLLAATLLVTGCGPTITAPDVVGMRLDAAHREFESLGADEFNDVDVIGEEEDVILRDANWVVIRQEPAAGSKDVDTDETISLFVGHEDDPETLELIPANSDFAQEMAEEEPREETASGTPPSDPSPTPTPTPRSPAFGSHDELRDFFDGTVEDIEWSEADTPQGRTRLLGVVPGTYATVELFGDPAALDEIAYQVVFDGTSLDANFNRAVPMIRMAQEYATEDAAKFVGSELDAFALRDLIPQHSRTRRFGDVYVRVIGIDVINTVNVTMTIGHPPRQAAERLVASRGDPPSPRPPGTRAPTLGARPHP